MVFSQHKALRICLGIITYHRKEKALRLLRKLSVQLTPQCDIFLVENGSQEMIPTDISLISNRIHLFHLPSPSISKSRNFLLHQATSKYDILAFIDDDCLPSRNWLKEIVTLFSQHPTLAIVQGAIKSVPPKNIFAQTSHALSQLWREKNTDGTLTKILDTKNILFNLSLLRKFPLQFDSTLPYASDIDLGYKILQRGLTIHQTNSCLVYHQERTNVFEFYKHRLRLALAFRKVAARYPHFFSRATEWEKAVYLFENLRFPLIKKIAMIGLLSAISCHVTLVRGLSKVGLVKIHRSMISKVTNGLL